MHVYTKLLAVFILLSRGSMCEWMKETTVKQINSIKHKQLILAGKNRTKCPRT